MERFIFMIKQLKKVLSDRLVMGGVLLALQMVLMITFIVSVSEQWMYAYRFFEFLSMVMIIWLVRKHDNPAYKIPWILAIILFPLFGGIFYLLWGNTPLNRARLIKIRPVQIAKAEKMRKSATEELKLEYPNYSRRCNYINTIAQMPVWRDTAVEFFPLGEDQFASMLEELQKAERFIFLEYFIIAEGEMWRSILSILAEKASMGLDVRVMYDDAGCITTLPKGYRNYLASLGIRAVSFNPFIPTLNTYLNYRDHRKICVIDGNIGYMGGINLADEYINKKHRFGHWKDTAFKLSGNAVINLTAMFLQLWDFASKDDSEDVSLYLPTKDYPSDGYIQPFGDSPLDDWNVSETVYMQIINNAKRYVYITSPYLVLDNEMLTALTTAAQSGVDVRIVTPGIPDKWYVYSVTRSFYAQLVHAGVKIYEYKPGFIHSKMIVSDDETCVVGTINMDFRSFYLHLECGTVFYHSSIVKSVHQDLLNVIHESREIDEAWLHGVPWLHSIFASILRIFAPIM